MAEKPQDGSQNRNNQNRQGGNRNKNRQGGNGNRNRQGGQRNGNRQGGQRNGNKGGNRNNQNRNGSKKQAPKKLTLIEKILSFFGVKPKQQAAKSQKQAPKKSASNTGNKKPAAKKPSQEGKRQPQKVEVESNRLYLGNLSFEATEYDLEDLFKGIGNVKGVEIIYNRHTHKSKGYGFIEMRNVEDAKRAVEVLHEQPFMGRNLIVNGAKGRRSGDDSAKKEA